MFPELARQHDPERNQLKPILSVDFLSTTKKCMVVCLINCHDAIIERVLMLIVIRFFERSFPQKLYCKRDNHFVP